MWSLTVVNYCVINDLPTLLVRCAVLSRQIHWPAPWDRVEMCKLAGKKANVSVSTERVLARGIATRLRVPHFLPLPLAVGVTLLLFFSLFLFFSLARLSGVPAGVRKLHPGPPQLQPHARLRLWDGRLPPQLRLRRSHRPPRGKKGLIELRFFFFPEVTLSCVSSLRTAFSNCCLPLWSRDG